MKGRVITSTGSWYHVKLEDGRKVDCRIKGAFRLKEEKITNPVAVGDLVNIAFEDGQQTAVIEEILPRKNYLSRQSPRQKKARHIIAANLDQAFIICTIVNPRTSTGFIDRFLITAEAYHIPAHIVFNKQDLLSDKDQMKQDKVVAMYQSIGYPVHFTSTVSGVGIDALVEHMKDKISLLAGHSGVGKSSLINTLIPNVQLKTIDISSFSGKGQHATTFAALYDLPSGGSIVDTPGIKEFGVLDLEPEEISHYYPEMRRLLDDCKFNNCLHVSEPKCAIKQAVEDGTIAEERYRNYCNILADCQAIEKY